MIINLFKPVASSLYRRGEHPTVLGIELSGPILSELNRTEDVHYKGYPLHVQTAGSGNLCTLHFHKRLLLVLLLIYDAGKIICKCQNVGMPEKVNQASAFLLVVNCLIPASAFWHQGSVQYRWSRNSPALPGCAI
jgi:hypothetical protein